MKKLFLTIMEGTDARHAQTILATCDKTLISKVAKELNVRLTGSDPQQEKSFSTTTIAAAN